MLLTLMSVFCIHLQAFKHFIIHFCFCLINSSDFLFRKRKHEQKKSHERKQFSLYILYYLQIPCNGLCVWKAPRGVYATCSACWSCSYYMCRTVCVCMRLLCKVQQPYTPSHIQACFIKLLFLAKYPMSLYLSHLLLYIYITVL